MKLNELFSLPAVIDKPDFICGVELEIENIGTLEVFKGFNNVEDGSLRNSGFEFVSAPFDVPTQMEIFKNLHAKIKYKSSGRALAFTPRTSIHVHGNCSNLDVDQVKSIILWYSLLEPVFFKMVDSKRSNSIFCVPLDQTSLPDYYCRPLKAMVHYWSKYTAFNIKPLGEKGTIEFRHMQGHDDAELHEEWLTVISNLWKYAKDNIPSKLTLRKDRFVMEAYEAIFSGTRVGHLGEAVIPMVENNLIDLKLSLL